MKSGRPFHVAFFNRSFYPDTAATGQFLTELCEELVEVYGCRVSVVAGGDRIEEIQRRGAKTSASLRLDSSFTEEQYRGIRILRARGTRFSKARFSGRFSNYVTYFLSACLAGLRLDRPDLVVALTDPPIIGLAGRFAARRFRVPFVMAFKDIFPEVARLLEDFNSPAIERILNRVTCHLARRADHVCALGESMKRRLVDEKGADPLRTSIIPDWVDCSAIRPSDKINPFSIEHGLDRKFVVMHSGNIGLSQGLEHVIEAAGLLRGAPDLEFVFVGEGVKKADLQARVETLGLKHVRFLPFQPKERLIESFATADLFIVSLKPGLSGYIVPSKLYGILAAGRPFVAAVEEDSEAVRIAREYECGKVVEFGDPRAMAEAIRELYEEFTTKDTKDTEISAPLRFSALKENARRAALQFDRPKVLRQYFDLFHRLASRPRELPTPFWKRSFDVAVSGLGILFSLPLWLVIALAVKLQDGGPVFYGQERVGRGGRHFRSWKFRSMVPDSDRRFGPLQAGHRDPRVTPVGRLLRATAMDELPQLWNIFVGDMSFVGPRALLPAEIETNGSGDSVAMESVEGYWERQRVTPGLTGIAQVYAPRDLPRRQKFRLDRLYVQKRCFRLDMKLFILSFWITFRGKWEEREAKL